MHVDRRQRLRRGLIAESIISQYVHRFTAISEHEAAISRRHDISANIVNYVIM